MTTFLRLLRDKDKEEGLKAVISVQGAATNDGRHFEVDPASFRQIPGAPFAYWVSDAVRGLFKKLPAFDTGGRSIRVGDHPGDGFRFLRLFWEVQFIGAKPVGWMPYQKGGVYSPFYADIHLVAYWNHPRQSYEGFYGRLGRSSERPSNFEHFFRPGLTWPRRTNGLSFRVMPAGCIFADKGPAAFVANDKPDNLLALSCLLNSSAFELLVSVQLARTELAQSYEVGLIQQTPIPPLYPDEKQKLATLAHRAWSLKRTLDTVTETSHAFLLPTTLRSRLGDFNSPAIEAELARIQAEIDDIAFELYGFDESDRCSVISHQEQEEEQEEEEVDEAATDHWPLTTDHFLLSWVVGVAFGRFDWRLATGKREAPPEPDPFDPLPAKSPGMLPDDAEPFHAHAGILVDDPGHVHDLARLVEEVLDRVNISVPNDVRRWLQRDFFPFHLKQYSKSRRKAPIYWPLSTTSGNYTLWVYYPRLTSQTLYVAINDFLEPKLQQVGSETTALRNKGTVRTREEEKRFEELQSFELELIEFRDTLLKIVQHYHPNHDDGVQITASPLWPLFRHKPWQKVLKDTWKKLEKGDYDWTHLAMNYWPERVRAKCKTDKSLAIAHGLEELYEEPPEQPKKTRRRGKAG